MEEPIEQPKLEAQPQSIATEEATKKERVDSVFRFEDMIRSEQAVNAYATSVASTESIVKPAEDKVFSKKVDQKKKLYAKRVKIATGVYVTIVGLLLLLVGVNITSLIMTSKAVNTDIETVKANSERIVSLEEQAAEATTAEDEILVTLNQPRDYSKEKTELTFLDKVTILIKNIFG